MRHFVVVFERTSTSIFSSHFQLEPALEREPLLTAFCGPEVLPVSQSTVSKHWRQQFRCCIFVVNNVQSRCNNNNNNNRFAALCLGLPGWASTRRNFHPPTILIIIQSLSAFSIDYDP